MTTWDERYREAAEVGTTLFTTSPSPTVVEAFQHVRILSRHRPSAVDVGAGEGRHSADLAKRGFFVTALEPSAEGIRSGRRLHPDTSIDWVRADWQSWTPDTEVDVVLIAYLHPPAGEAIEDALPHVATWIKPSGWIVLVGHSRAQYGLNVPGPGDKERLWDAESIKGTLESCGFETVFCDDIERRAIKHQDDTGTDNEPAPIDVVLVAQKNGD